MTPWDPIGLLADDLEAVPRLAAWLHDEWPGVYSAEHAARTIAPLVNRDRLPFALVARDGMLDPMGMVGVIAGSTPRGEPAAVLLALYVAPPYRRRGVGGALCARAVSEARTMGWPTVAAYTPDRDAFYRRLGWQSAMRAIVTAGPVGLPVWYIEAPDPPGG